MSFRDALVIAIYAENQMTRVSNSNGEQIVPVTDVFGCSTIR
jgi:hypothetical protein